MITSFIGNALTKIRNAVRVRHEDVTVDTNNLIVRILGILKDCGFIEAFELKKLENNKNIANIKLKYTPNPSIVELKLISKPGRRCYVKSKDIPRVYNGLGIGILSTSKGVMNDKEARRQNVGGELICTVF